MHASTSFTVRLRCTLDAQTAEAALARSPKPENMLISDCAAQLLPQHSGCTPWISPKTLHVRDSKRAAVAATPCPKRPGKARLAVTRAPLRQQVFCCVEIRCLAPAIEAKLGRQQLTASATCTRRAAAVSRHVERAPGRLWSGDLLELGMQAVISRQRSRPSSWAEELLVRGCLVSALGNCIEPRHARLRPVRLSFILRFCSSCGKPCNAGLVHHVSCTSEQGTPRCSSRARERRCQLVSDDISRQALDHAYAPPRLGVPCARTVQASDCEHPFMK